jgi:hypothetical protein
MICSSEACATVEKRVVSYEHSLKKQTLGYSSSENVSVGEDKFVMIAGANHSDSAHIQGLQLEYFNMPWCHLLHFGANWLLKAQKNFTVT